MKDGVKRVFVVDTSDQRLKTVKELLQKDGFEVLEFASGQKYLHNSHIQHIFIFPPYVPIDYKIANALSLDSVVFGLGCFDQEAQKALKEKSIIARFYNNDEILVMKNAYLTAEGALAAIINNTPKALKCQKILILGYGRVGKALAKILDDLRAEVSVATNDKQEFAHAAVYLQNTYTLDNFDKDLTVFDVIINTVPKMILKGERLQHIRKDAFVIDLASLPGGVDIEAAKNLGINCLHYLGVPAKTAAQTAGLYLYESVKRALEEIGEGL